MGCISSHYFACLSQHALPLPQQALILYFAMVPFSQFVKFISSRKWLSLLVQAALWVALFSLPFILRPSYEGGHKQPIQRPPEWAFVAQYIINCVTWIALTYLNTAVLLPKYFNHKKYGRYSGLLLLIFLVMLGINWAAFRLLLPGLTFRLSGFVLFYMFPALFFLACSTAISFFRDKLRSDQLTKERETENLKTELLFLRSQVSPHFLFNVLNNMVALARKGSEELEPSLIKLSSLLRYMLYEAAAEKVLLQKELDYLQSYIDLQTQRFRKNLKVRYNLGEIDRAYLLEPMLLIPFVENAFKHGAVGTPDAAIEIDLRAVKGVLHLVVRNKFHPEAGGEKDKDSGIGLSNVHRRLSLLYPDQHALLIQRQADWFTVSLTINLH